MSFRTLRAVLLASLVLAGGACNSTASPPSIRQSVTYLASDELEGRGVGTRGLDEAADYIAEQFQASGLKTMPGLEGFDQPFRITIDADVDDESTLRTDKEPLTLDEDFRPTGFSASGSFRASVVFAGYGILSEDHNYDDYANINVKGKVVLALRYEPHDKRGKSRFVKGGYSDHATLGRKARVAQSHGAVAVLLVNPPDHHGRDELMPFASQFMGGGSKIPFIHITQEIANDLLSRGQAPDLKTLQASIDNSSEPHSVPLKDVTARGKITIDRKTSTVRNIVGLLPGRGPKADEYIVVGAHYDHIGRQGMFPGTGGKVHNGADDNASGTAALIELARRLSDSAPLERSVIFIAFTAEEMGLLGSNHFVENPPVPLEKIIAMVNMDMVGRIRNQTLYVGGTGTAGEFESMLRHLDQRSPLQVKGIGKSGMGPSDHMAFATKEIPVLFFFSGLHGDYHRPSDDVEKINFEAMSEVVAFTLNTIDTLDDMPRQEYVRSADVAGHSSFAGGARRVMLGVVPDYSAYSEAGGVKITGTVPESPAEKAGLRPGDKIVEFAGRQIDTMYDLADALSESKTGEQVSIRLLRGDQPMTVQATLVEKKGN